MNNRIFILLVCALLSSCATIIDGNDQKIMVNSQPPGATCKLLRDGKELAVITTPNLAAIEKTKHDITIECSKPGYKTTMINNHSGIDWWTAGNLAILTPTGWAIDSIAGSDNKYTSPINIVMEKL